MANSSFAAPRRMREAWLGIGAGMIALALLLVFGILSLIATRGLGHFWPDDLWEIELAAEAGAPRAVLAIIADEETATDRSGANRGRVLLRSGNRDLAPPEFFWVDARNMRTRSRPADAGVIERRARGNAHGYVDAVLLGERALARGPESWAFAEKLLADVQLKRTRLESERRTRIAALARASNNAQERLRRAQAESGVGSAVGTRSAQADAARLAYREATADLRRREVELARTALLLRLADGTLHRVPIVDIERMWRPNGMSIGARLAHQADSIAAFLSRSPREGNTEGGIYPAIVGTVVLVLLMAVMVAPLGVLCALYLHEYARPGPGVRLLRIAVNNLAGVPSIVYGVFGLGFFVYVLGGSLDALFFADTLPSPTLGTPGLLWAALTLALLTMPVVIVSTEEGLSRIPKDVREGSLALGATRSETLRSVILPSAAPAILTGVILAVARAAGEVAPLMLVGVVKLAPRLPIDGEPPFLHLDRQFMHLGFHIYDVGFQSPNVEAARPVVFATALLLVLVIVALNLTAIVLRNRLHRRYGVFDV